MGTSYLILKYPNFRDTYILLLRMGPVMARPRPSSLRTHQERGPLRFGRCRDWRHTTHSHSHHEIWDAYINSENLVHNSTI